MTNDELQEPVAEAVRTADMAKSATSAPPSKNKLQSTGVEAGRNADIANSAISAPAQGTPAALSLTSTGARKVEMALVALDACQSESKIQTQQASNCQLRAEAAEDEVKRLQSSVASLNQALQAKDKILARQQSESKAELRAARGTFLGRLAHTAEHVAFGVVMGVAIGVAVK